MNTIQDILRELDDEDRLTCVNYSSELPIDICQCIGCRAKRLMAAHRGAGEISTKGGDEPCAPPQHSTQDIANASTLQSTSTGPVDIAGASNAPSEVQSLVTGATTSASEVLTPRMDAAFAKEDEDELWAEACYRILDEGKKIEKELTIALRDKEYFISTIAESKRPFSDKFSADVIAGQVKELDALRRELAAKTREVEEVREANRKLRNSEDQFILALGGVTIERDEARAKLREVEEKAEDAFIDRLFVGLAQLGISTEDWDGEDDPAMIIARKVASLRDAATEEIRTLREWKEAVSLEWERQKNLFPDLHKDGWMDDLLTRAPKPPAVEKERTDPMYQRLKKAAERMGEASSRGEIDLPPSPGEGAAE